MIISSQAGACIPELVVHANPSYSDAGQWLVVIDESCDGLVIEKLVLVGCVEASNFRRWAETVANGVLVLANKVKILRYEFSRLHVGLEVRGADFCLDSWQAELACGDCIQGDGQRPVLKNGLIIDPLAIFSRIPGKIYHEDIIQWRGQADGGLIDGVQVQSTGNPWGRMAYQGVLFADGIFKGWTVKNLELNGVHPNHAVTFAEAHDCYVENVSGGGAVRFRDLNGVASSGCRVFNCDGPIEGAEKKMDNNAKKTEIFDPVTAFGFPNSDAVTAPILFNNPCAVKKYESWQGEVPRESRPEFMSDKRRPDLLRFVSPEWGIRCACRILQNKQRQNTKSVRQLISSWAPSVGKNADNTSEQTENYIQHVARRMNVEPDQVISVLDYATIKPMILAMIEVENGWNMPYSDQTIDTGLMLSGIAMPNEEPVKVKPATQSGERKGAVVIGSGAVIGGSTTITGWLMSQGLTHEQANAVVNGATNAITNVDAISSGMNWVLILLIVNTICWIGAGLGAWWWYRSRQLAGEMLLR